MKCPICNSPATEKVYENRRAHFMNSNKKFAVVLKLCVKCGFVFQSSAYSRKYDKVVEKVYASFRKNELFGFPDRRPENIEAVKIITDNAPDRRRLNILEIGSNRGDLLYMLKEKLPGANIVGVEPTGFENLSVPTLKCSFDKHIFSNKFDVIILQHVLEHIKYPKSMAADIEDILSEDGIIYIEVPYLNNSLKYCVEDFVPEHVSFFNIASLNNVFRKASIKVCGANPFLKIVAKPKNNTQVKNDSYKIKYGFDRFENNKKDMLKTISRHSRERRNIVFYGVSYYFQGLFGEIKGMLRKKSCYYFDDNFTGRFEKVFRLPRIKKIKRGDTVIICSTNVRVQEDIERRLHKLNGITIIRPWFRATYPGGI